MPAGITNAEYDPFPRRTEDFDAPRYPLRTPCATSPLLVVMIHRSPPRSWLGPTHIRTRALLSVFLFPNYPIHSLVDRATVKDVRLSPLESGNNCRAPHLSLGPNLKDPGISLPTSQYCFGTERRHVEFCNRPLGSTKRTSGAERCCVCLSTYIRRRRTLEPPHPPRFFGFSCREAPPTIGGASRKW